MGVNNLDYLIKAIDQTKNFRLILLNAKQMLTDAVEFRTLARGSYQALGESLIATSLLSTAELVDDEELTVRIQTDSDLGNIVITGQSSGDVKGYISNPEILDFKKLETGMLTVSKDLGLKEPFNGQIPLLPVSIAENFVAYLANSEQIQSAMGISFVQKLNQEVQSAGGFLIQALPGATEKQITQLENRLKNLNFEQVLQNDDSTKIVADLIGSNAKILAESVAKFNCDCSKEKFGAIIKTLDKNEIQMMIDEDHGAIANCKFCGKSYEFTEQELKDMIKNR